MLRLFRRGGGIRLSALLAAGALGLARPALAEVPLPDGPPAGGHAVHPSAAAGRLSEIKVELAWIGDSTTFPYALSAHARGNSLQVCGQVPSEVVRRQALQLARAASSLTIQDALVVQPKLPPAPLTATGEELLPRVRWVLSDVLGARAPTIEVGTRMGGHIILRGTVASWEEKHTVSVRLHEIRGCASVVNLLAVSSSSLASPLAPAPRWQDAKPEAPVMPRAAHPGRLAPPPLPTPRLPDVPQPKPASEPPLMPRIMPPAVRLPASPTDSHIQVGATEAAGPVIATADTVPAPTAPIATGAATPMSPYHATPAPLSAPLVKAVEETPPPKATPKPRVVSGFARKKTAPLSCGTPTRDWPTAAQRRVAVSASSLYPVKPSMGARLAAWFKGKPKAETAIVLPPRKTHNGWLAGSRPAFLSARVQKKARRLRSGSIVPDRPYVTKGTIVFNDSPASAAAPASHWQPVGVRGPAPTAPPSAEQLRQRVLRVCAGQAREVHVEPRPDQSMQVTIKVPDAQTEKNLLGRVLQLPEMAAPNVRLFVEVAH